MKVQHRITGVTGWAIQMAGPYTFDGRRQAANTYIVEIQGRRFVVFPDEFTARYRTASERRTAAA